MTWSFQTIVDVECLDEAEAADLGAKVLQHLIDREIVEPEPSGREHVPERGHAPGRRFVDALAEAELLPDDVAHVRAILMNVVQVIDERAVHHAGEGGVEIECPACGATGEPPPEWGDAVGEWFDDRGPAMLSCGACGASHPVTEWHHHPPYGFSCLGISFSNWPPLSAELVRSVGALLGHRVILVRGHL